MLKKFIKVIVCICILICVAFIVFNKKTINLDNMNLKKYDFETYTIIPYTSDIVEVIDENGKVLDKYNFENRIDTYKVYKNYNSNKLWYESSNHNSESSKARLVGYYDLKTKDIEYKENLFTIENEDDSNLENELYLISNVDDRYRLYETKSGIYLSDEQLGNCVKLDYDFYMTAKFIQTSETGGFYQDSQIFCYVDFESEEVNNYFYVDFENEKANIYYKDLDSPEKFRVQNMEGALDGKVIVYTDSNEFILVDSEFNTYKLDNINPEYDWVQCMDKIEDNKIIINQLKTKNGPNNKVIPVVVSILDLDTNVMTNLTNIYGNGEDYFAYLYTDDTYLYMYAYNEEDKNRFIILDKFSYEVVNEIVIDPKLFVDAYLEIPILIKN